jgi:hypothetical protein
MSERDIGGPVALIMGVSAAKIGATASRNPRWQADHEQTIRSFREQAERAERLARSISDDEASKRLVEASKEFRRQAEQLDERPHKSVLKRP